MDKPLTKPQQKAIRALCMGVSRTDAYIAGYPLAAKWSAKLLTAKADKLFDSASAQIFQKSLVDPTNDTVDSAPEKKPARRKAKHPGGRPTKYKPEYAKKMLEYFDVEPGYDEVVETKSGDLKSVHHANDLPTKAEFAWLIGVDRDTLKEWANKKDEDGNLVYPEFSAAYKRVQDAQERILITNGLKGGYQANFAIFTAKNVLGWRDKQDLGISGSDGGPVRTITSDMPPELASEIYQECMHKG